MRLRDKGDADETGCGRERERGDGQRETARTRWRKWRERKQDRQ